MKTVTIEIPDDSELIKEGNIYKIYRVIPKTWEEFLSCFRDLCETAKMLL